MFFSTKLSQTRENYNFSAENSAFQPSVGVLNLVIGLICFKPGNESGNFVNIEIPDSTSADQKLPFPRSFVVERYLRDRDQTVTATGSKFTKDCK